jgi:hypothetical protein
VEMQSTLPPCSPSTFEPVCLVSERGLSRSELVQPYPGYSPLSLLRRPLHSVRSRTHLLGHHHMPHRRNSTVHRIAELSRILSHLSGSQPYSPAFSPASPVFSPQALVTPPPFRLQARGTAPNLHHIALSPLAVSPRVLRSAQLLHGGILRCSYGVILSVADTLDIDEKCFNNKLYMYQ